MKHESGLEFGQTLPDGSRERYDELILKLGDNFFQAKLADINDMPPNKLVETYKYLIDTAYGSLKYIPKHTEEITRPVIQDFHHFSPGTFGEMTYTVNVPDKWTLTDEGNEKIGEYLKKLREEHGTKDKGLRKFFRRILR
jgi:hypothetical protein